MSFYVLYKIIKKLAIYFKCPSLNKLANNIFQCYIKKFLINGYEIRGEYTAGVFSNKVWLCWLQGFNENTPEIVSKCRKSIYKNIPADYEIIELNEYNFNDYVEISPIILRKYHEGKITKTQFSDILRCNILNQHGGLWIDATIFLNKNLNFLLKHDGFLSLKSDCYDKLNTISNGKWTVYFLQIGSNSSLMRFLSGAMNLYWERFTNECDYFFLDHLISIYYSECNDFRRVVDELPSYGDNRFLLHSLLNNPLSSDIKKIQQDKIGIYKLTYKEKFIERVDGEATFYGYFFGVEG